LITFYFVLKGRLDSNESTMKWVPHSSPLLA
jgi:hypothetical protein